MSAAPAPILPDPLAAPVWALLEAIEDPEIPVISLVDLGVVRSVVMRAANAVEVGLTPTYSGCPANDVIHALVREKLAAAGYVVTLKTVLAPPWTTDWLSERGRARLIEYGIAPPARLVRGGAGAAAEPASCPRCGSSDTERLAEFSSTPCKALYRCRACREPFEQFKCI